MSEQQPISKDDLDRIVDAGMLEKESKSSHGEQPGAPEHEMLYYKFEGFILAIADCSVAMGTEGLRATEWIVTVYYEVFVRRLLELSEPEGTHTHQWHRQLISLLAGSTAS